MRAYLIIIFQVRQQYVTEVPLSEHNNVVKAFPSDRTDQPFGVCILPRGAWRRWPVANAHRSKSSDEDIAIGLIAIADQIVGSPFPAEGFRNLICNPFCGRMRCDAEPYDLSSAVPPSPMPVIGYLGNWPAGSELTIDGFRRGLKETGFVEGHNVVIDYLSLS